ncbi:hypothetical protein GCM10009745_17820 [Kribbella yunnanensis]|uniref:DUF465 domain-containing protein n=1 Tax=Kribbella yunnanensis TaxID=190194 RepID=A0ABN2GQI8_9ACTN
MTENAESSEPPRPRLVVPRRDLDRLHRRAEFLRELEEAKALRDRIAPRRARVRRLREAMRRATYHH